MNAAGSQPSLRPLGVGEVLDRAVTLCVKHFVVLATIFVVYAVPFAVLQFFAGRDLAAVMATLQAALGATSAAGKPADPAILAHALAAMPALGPWYPLLVLTLVVIAPLPAAALIEACAALYLGRPATFVGAYRTALGRWPQLVALNLLYAFVGIVLYVVLIVAVIALTIGVALVTAAVHILGVAIGVVLVFAATVAGIAFFIVAWLALQVSYFTCVVERANAVTSFSVGLRRVFAGVGLVRSLLVGVAYLAIGIGIGLVALVGESVLIGLLHSQLAGSAYATIVRVATAAFTTAFVAIFYFDLRVREEGLDLQLDAERARAQPVPQA
ncbi:MAG: hypothetical protein NVSMB19_03130 [Vulcanimicrobiaceae bacterium]